MKAAEITEREVTALPIIHEGRACLLYLDTNDTFGKPAVIKALRRGPAAKQYAGRLANEYGLTAGLQLPGVRRALAQFLIDGQPALALEYVEGDTLYEAFVRERRPLAENLEIAIFIAGVLEEMHQQNLVHRNLSSAHILVSPSRRAATLIGFGGASLMNGKCLRPEAADLSSAALAYIAPEQTGRINRLVDQRADLYSFGAVLYEVLTGKPPFASDDPAELVHLHLAQKPVPPEKVNPDVPGAVSDIVMRLLAKNPDERYQSAFGVKADLENCLSQLRQSGRIGELELGRADYRRLFQLPEKLYGREAELEALKTAMKSAAKGAGRAIMLSGLPGVGKTALAEEFQRYVTGQGALFIRGWHDSARRNVPYAGLLHAFGALIDHILTEGAEELARWKERILQAAGGNGSLLIGMLPRLELVIGAQPPAPELGPAEAQNRFHSQFQNFLLAFARREHPLVLFLDDLQWADQASLHLLNSVLPVLGSHPILFLGAYRNDEIGPEHPLASLLDAIKPLGTALRTITLGNLPLAAVSRLIADTLAVPFSYAEPLAQVVLEKTGGNALFIRLFLQFVHDGGLLRFDAQDHRWVWDIAGIGELEIMRSAATLMAEKLGRLPEDVKSTLSIAACIGNRFESKTLVEVAGLPVQEIAKRLAVATEAGLVQQQLSSLAPMAVPAEAAAGPEALFEFPHDQVRQAAYALLTQKRRRLVHLQIGRRLLAQTLPDSVEERVFEIVDHLNEGFQYLSVHPETS